MFVISRFHYITSAVYAGLHSNYVSHLRNPQNRVAINFQTAYCKQKLNIALSRLSAIIRLLHCECLWPWTLQQLVNADGTRNRAEHARIDRKDERESNQNRIVNKMETRIIGNSFSFTICTSTVMYLVCLPTFGITFSCFLIVPGY